MPRYDWSMPVFRVFVGTGAAALVVIGSHLQPKYRTELVICNGGWHAGVSVFLQLLLAVPMIEVLTWAIWFFAVRPKDRPLEPAIDDADGYVLSGGEFLGPKPSYASLALAVVLVFLSVRFIGIPDVCPELDLTKFSLRLFLGGLLMMYGLMIGMDYFKNKSDARDSNSTAQGPAK
jgi:hypothetical protein